MSTVKIAPWSNRSVVDGWFPPNRLPSAVLLLACSLVFPGSLSAQQGPQGDDPAPEKSRFQEDHEVFHFLLERHHSITRQIKDLENGVETLTESDDPEVADKIKEHVHWMSVRIKDENPIRMRDPLFREIFKHAEEIKISHVDTEKGVKVIETSSNPYVAKLIQEHARVVSKFVAAGHAEARKNHPVPERLSDTVEPTSSKGLPPIQGYGSIVPMPDATQQPRPGTRLCLDVTTSGEWERVNPGLEKVARCFNIYASAGTKGTDAQFAVIIHGGALPSILHAEKYRLQFGTDGNPNIDLLQKLHDAGVTIYVCGQAMAQKEWKKSDILPFIEVAVSAITANANHQLDGYLLINVP